MGFWEQILGEELAHLPSVNQRWHHRGLADQGYCCDL